MDRSTLLMISGTIVRPGTGIPRLVWGVFVTAVLLFWAYGVVFPQYRAPDEPQHVDLTLSVGDGVDYPQFDEAFITERVVASLDLVRFRDRSKNLLVAEAVDRSERPTFEQLGTLTPSGQPNTLAAHPPLYYWVFGGVSSAVTSVGSDGWVWDEEAALLRALNGLLSAATVLVVYRIAEVVGLSLAARIAASMLVLAVPRLAEIASSVNNDNLLMLLASLVLLSTVRIARGDLSWSTTVVGGLALGLAMFTKGFALVLPIVVILGFVPSFRSGRGREALQRLAAFAALALMAGGWWWFRNLVVHGALQPARRMLPTAVDFVPDGGTWVERFFRVGNWKFWGVFGWFDVSLPVLVTVIASLVVIGAMIVALVKTQDRWVSWTLLALPVLLMVVVAQNAWRSYARTGGFAFIQGRYLFSAIAVIAVLAAAGFVVLLGTRASWAPVALWIGASVLHVWAMLTIFPFYWGDPNASIGGRFEAMFAWSAWPAFATALIVGSALLAWLALGVVLTRSASRRLGV